VPARWATWASTACSAAVSALRPFLPCFSRLSVEWSSGDIHFTAPGEAHGQLTPAVGVFSLRSAETVTWPNALSGLPSCSSAMRTSSRCLVLGLGGATLEHQFAVLAPSGPKCGRDLSGAEGRLGRAKGDNVDAVLHGGPPVRSVHTRPGRQVAHMPPRTVLRWRR
jgi:hypothetical protein